MGAKRRSTKPRERGELLREEERERTKKGQRSATTHQMMCMCICGRKTREERMARGLFGRVAKEEKIRGLYAEGSITGKKQERGGGNVQRHGIS